jgi:hypothetical protein
MSDKELLEMAAKAAGLTFDWGASPLVLAMPSDTERPWRYWHPLEDDGDAFRLAVNLRISVEYTFGGVEVSASWRVNKVFAGNAAEEIGSLHNGDDPNAAVRRAIVRAAAYIGKAMQASGSRP